MGHGYADILEILNEIPRKQIPEIAFQKLFLTNCVGKVTRRMTTTMLRWEIADILWKGILTKYKGIPGEKITFKYVPTY